MTSSSRVLERMDALVTRAKLAVFHAVMPDTEDTEKAGDLAAAITNELFGETAQIDHVERFGKDEIEMSARALLLRDSAIKALSVQAVRVVNVIRINEGKDPIGMELLREFGKVYPDSPSPDSFEKLVTEFEEAHGVEHRLKPKSYSNLVDEEIQALRQENPWYLWPSRILFWVAFGYGIYWLIS